MEASSANDAQGKTWFGVSLAVMGTMISALGNHLIVKSHVKTSSKSSSSSSHQQQQVYFWLGNFCVVVLGTACGILALAYAPQSLISPLGGLTIVWNLALATLPIFGGIKPKSVEIFATMITLLGTMVIVWLGPENRGQKNTFWLFLKPSFAVLVLLYSGLGALLESLKSQTRLYARISSGAMGGLVGGISNVFAKSAIDFHSGNQVAAESHDFVSFSLVVTIALGLAASQLMFLNNALASFPAVQIVPIYQTSLIIAATISGGVAFDEFATFSFFQYLGFTAGVSLSVLGVAVLASVGSASSTSSSSGSAGAGGGGDGGGNTNDEMKD